MTGRRDVPAGASRPSPHPRPAPGPTPAGPSLERLAAYARWVLAMHQPRPAEYGYRPHWCSCGSALVLCPYRSAATRYLNPPAR